MAGQFYTGDRARLAREVGEYLRIPDGKRRSARAVMVPHAGYVYSGRVAGVTFASVELPVLVVLLAVNHRGVGEPFASWSSGAWQTPLGELEVDAELVAAIARHATFVRHDPRAHVHEHSLEVQLPFLQVGRRSPPRIAPISISSHELPRLIELGEAVAQAVRGAGEPVLIVASSDMSHYEDAASARRKDEAALGQVAAVDGPGLLRTVLAGDISMCGVGPTTAALVAARALGATEGEIVAYADSGDVTGDKDSVVGYAGAVIA